MSEFVITKKEAYVLSLDKLLGFFLCVCVCVFFFFFLQYTRRIERPRLCQKVMRSLLNVISMKLTKHQSKFQLSKISNVNKTLGPKITNTSVPSIVIENSVVLGKSCSQAKHTAVHVLPEQKMLTASFA